MATPEAAAHRLTLVKSTGEQDGGALWIHLRTLAWDNGDLLCGLVGIGLEAGFLCLG